MNRSIRALAACALGLLPAAAAAQSLSVSPTSFSQQDCRDGATAVVTYQVVSESSTTTPRVQLFATTESCPAPDSNASSVTAPSDAIVLVANRDITNADISSDTKKLKARDVAKGDCSAQVSYTWNLCLYEFWSTTSGTSTTYTSTQKSQTFTYDALPPAPPRVVGVTPGDQHLHVDLDGPGDDDVSYYEAVIGRKDTSVDEAIAASERDGGGTYDAYDCYPGAQTSKLGADTGSVLVPATGDAALTNDITYVVQLRAVDGAGNKSACSNPADGTPQLIDDFWRQYKKDGGQERGCASAGGATLAPLALVALLWLRRSRARSHFLKMRAAL